MPDSSASGSVPRPRDHLFSQETRFPSSLRAFWQRQVDAAEQEAPDYRHPALPLARIKKVMKSDPEVKQMIAADAPILFCKACEIFIAEITARAFIVADSNKRRTLSRQDIVRALAKSDQFDFLIDIVPREEPFAGQGPGAAPGHAGDGAPGGGGGKSKRAGAGAGAAGGASQVHVQAQVAHSGAEDRKVEQSEAELSSPIHQLGVPLHSLESRPGTSGGASSGPLVPGPVPGADALQTSVMLDQWGYR